MALFLRCSVDLVGGRNLLRVLKINEMRSCVSFLKGNKLLQPLVVGNGMVGVWLMSGKTFGQLVYQPLVKQVSFLTLTLQSRLRL